MNKLFQQVVEDNDATPGLRRRRSAALVLYGMSEADRAWALAELSAEERAVLQPLIDELQALGMPADTDWVSTALGMLPRIARGRETVNTVHRQVARALPEQVVSVLLDEPVELVRRLLGMASWPWRAEVVAALNALRGDLFETSPALASSGTTALDQAVLARFAQQLSGQERGDAAGFHVAQGAAGAMAGSGWRTWLRARGWLR